MIHSPWKLILIALCPYSVYEALNHWCGKDSVWTRTITNEIETNPKKKSVAFSERLEVGGVKMPTAHGKLYIYILCFIILLTFSKIHQNERILFVWNTKWFSVNNNYVIFRISYRIRVKCHLHLFALNVSALCVVQLYRFIMVLSLSVL